MSIKTIVFRNANPEIDIYYYPFINLPGSPGGPLTTVTSSSYSFSFPCPKSYAKCSKLNNGRTIKCMMNNSNATLGPNYIRYHFILLTVKHLLFISIDYSTSNEMTKLESLNEFLNNIPTEHTMFIAHSFNLIFLFVLPFNFKLELVRKPFPFT